MSVCVCVCVCVREREWVWGSAFPLECLWVKHSSEVGLSLSVSWLPSWQADWLTELAGWLTYLLIVYIYMSTNASQVNWHVYMSTIVWTLNSAACGQPRGRNPCPLTHSGPPLTHFWSPLTLSWLTDPFLSPFWSPTDPFMAHWPIHGPLTHSWPADLFMAHWPILGPLTCS